MRPDLQPDTRDPLAAYMAGAFLSADKRPIPLLDTRFAVRIEAGLAQVDTTRVFRNAEDRSIEVTITFPVPVHASLFGLSARIGDRHLVARAKRREAAREEYEEAVDGGHTAVLHEEVLKGVHTLSIAHVPPGVEIAVETRWAMPLSVVAGKGTLRIPLTIGDIYGRSPLSESDDLVAGGPQLTGRLSVKAEGQKVWLHGRPIDGSEITVPLNRPIDLAVPMWIARERKAVAADGSAFAVTITPAPDARTPVRVAVLIDHSGSMNETVSLLPRRTTKHQAVKQALAAAAKSLLPGDRLAVWEFDDAAARVGTVMGSSDGGTMDVSTIERLSDPRGGTEIGGALERLIAAEPESDILLVTDGKSYALDVSALARHARRISVLLVGEDSLEANVGYLAALTGGDIFVASGERVDEALKSAMASLRAATGIAKAGEVRRSGALIAWRHVTETPGEREPMNDALVALAAGLEFRVVPEAQAAQLAERYGLVTHLTSLVLVDEAGETQEGLPALRKVALPSPATIIMGAIHACRASPPHSLNEDAFERRSARSSAFALFDDEDQGDPRIVRLAHALDWTADPAGLAAGDADALVTKRLEDREWFKQMFAALVARRDVEALARELGKPALLVVILLLAYVAKNKDRTADRLLRAEGLGENLEKLRRLVLADQ